jgi:hypothetical protein
MTDNTSNSIRLNSSKQLQAPDDANPLKNLAIECTFNPSEQLNTTHFIAIHLPRSLVDSVLPVPAGPSGANLY